jgi:hypothetical protein
MESGILMDPHFLGKVPQLVDKLPSTYSPSNRLVDGVLIRGGQLGVSRNSEGPVLAKVSAKAQVPTNVMLLGQGCCNKLSLCQRKMANIR